MTNTLAQIIDSYDPDAPLENASTIPSSWYTDTRLYELEQETVFSRSWQLAARVDQLRDPGQYVTCEIGNEPIVTVCGNDRQVRGFFNVCRHHAAAVMTDPAGTAPHLRCPYHGWTYSLEGALKGAPDFSGVCDFDKSANGLLPVETATWENWAFVRLGNQAAQPVSLNDF
ncbi:MAG TPA: Rieske (2Fe-2S) protein, partial [Pyrinomonadaceae bacterium]|nr:Rieske (2Fe-2S) protein [Pyrinomonadaceae bacterium]